MSVVICSFLRFLLYGPWDLYLATPVVDSIWQCSLFGNCCGLLGKPCVQAYTFRERGELLRKNAENLSFYVQ